MSPDLIDVITNWIAFAAVIPFAGYTFTYGRGAPWFRSLLGVVMFSLGVSVTLALGYVAVRRTFGDFPGYEWLSLGVYSLLAVVGFALWAIVIIERRRTPLLQIPLNRKAESMSVKTADGIEVDVPRIWYEGQRVLRTIVSVGIPAFLGFALLLPEIIAALGLPADSRVRLWLLGVAAVVTAIAGAITRIMAIPAVNTWLTKIGLGSVPRKALEARVVTDDDGGEVQVITKVAPPKPEPEFNAVG